MAKLALKAFKDYVNKLKHRMLKQCALILPIYHTWSVTLNYGVINFRVKLLSRENCNILNLKRLDICLFEVRLFLHSAFNEYCESQNNFRTQVPT